MSSRRLISWLLALALLLGQAAAFAHALSHLDTHDSVLPDKVCEVCVAQASLGSAAPATVLSLPVVSGLYIDVSAEAPPPAAVSPHFAQSRAPPAAI